MNRLGVLLVCAAALAMMCSAAPAAERVFVKGVIIGVDPNNNVFALHTQRGDIRIGVNEETKIFRNGQAVHLADLQRGDFAAVGALKDGDRFMALFVRAHSHTEDFLRAHGTLGNLAPDGSFTLTTDRGDVPLVAGPRTEIRINGQLARFADLKNGDQAEVVFTMRKNDKGQHLAVRIGVRRG